MRSRRKDDDVLGVCSVGRSGRRSKASNSVKGESAMFEPNSCALMDSDKELNSIEDENARGYYRECVAHVWQAIEDRRIMLYMAAVGYDYDSGNAVYDYDLLIDLLINYGYDVNTATLFAGELSRSKWPDGAKRIVMNSEKNAMICSEVEPLDDNPCISD